MGRYDDGDFWRIIAFIPAPTGWRWGWLNDDGSITWEDMPGWVIEEFVSRRGREFEPLLRDTRLTPALGSSDWADRSVDSVDGMSGNTHRNNFFGPFGPMCSAEIAEEMIRKESSASVES
jgi:hypothetical protein